jgi:hypothetical protein
MGSPKQKIETLSKGVYSAAGRFLARGRFLGHGYSQGQFWVVHTGQKRVDLGRFLALLAGEKELSNFFEKNSCHHYIWCYRRHYPTT